MIECHYCNFWKPINTQLGECRKRAPIIRSIDSGQATPFWPYTSKSDGCGEGEAKSQFNNEGNEDLT